MKKDDVEQFSKTIEKKDLKTENETITLIKQFQQTGDAKLLNKICEINKGLVVSFVTSNAIKFINCQCSSYPTFEDLVQEGMLKMANSIEKFDLKKNAAFSTYIYTNLTNLFNSKFGRKMKKIEKTTGIKANMLERSLYEKISVNENLSTELVETIPDLKFGDFNDLTEKIQIKQFEEDILSTFPQKQQEYYFLYWYESFSLKQIGELKQVSTQYVSKMLNNIMTKMKDFFSHGMSDVDKVGISLHQSKKQRLLKSQQILKRYGKNFLKQAYLPTLPKEEQEIFNNAVLNYYGQDDSEICKHKIPGKKASSAKIDEMIQAFETAEPKLKQLQESGTFLEVPLSERQANNIKINNKLMEKYGGKFFLAKYFLPKLKYSEKKFFKVGVLQYDGDPLKVLAKKCHTTPEKFVEGYKKVIKKLHQTNFETIKENKKITILEKK